MVNRIALQMAHNPEHKPQQKQVGPLTVMLKGNLVLMGLSGLRETLAAFMFNTPEEAKEAYKGLRGIKKGLKFAAQYRRPW